MRAQLGRIYQGVQAAAALYVLATLALAVSAAPEAAAVSSLSQAADLPAPAPQAPDPIASVPRESVPDPEVPHEPARPKVAIGVTIPEGQFDFEPAGTGPLAGIDPAEPDVFPFAPSPPDSLTTRTGPPLIYRRGRLSGPLRVIRNPWSDPANRAFNQRGDAGRARAFAFDDRPEPAPGGGGNLDPASVVKAWKRDVGQFRTLRNGGHQEEELRHRLGDRYSSVRWAASLDVALEELPPPTDAYAAALNRERKLRAR